MINNKIFSNVIDFEIIQHLINYLLINNNKYCDIEYSIKRLNNNFNEILNYSLISKKWYELISNLISNNIENNNYNSIENWFDKDGFKLNLNFNKEFSIIKINEKIIKDYFKEILVLDSNYNNNNFNNNNKETLLKFKKIKINFFTKENQGIEQLFKNSNNNSNNIELNIIGLNFDDEYSNNILSIFKDYNDDDYRNYLKTNKLIINKADYEDYDGKLINILKYFNAKHIEYDPNGDYCQDSYPHVNYSNLFKKESIGNRIESIKIANSDHVEPIDLININQFSNLYTISIPLLIHVIIKGNGKSSNYFENTCDYHYGDLERTNDIIKEWDQMIDSFLTCKSLKNLKLENFCSKLNCLKKEYSYNNISNGIKRLLLNKSITDSTKSGIKYLKLFNFKFQLFSSIILENDDFNFKSTIKTLVLENYNLFDSGGGNEFINFLKNDLIYLFSNILTLNNFHSIKHLKLKFYSSTLLSTIIEQLFKNINDLNLYSITLYIDQNKFNDILEFVKLVLESENEPIYLKEINLIIEEDVNGKDKDVDEILNGKLKEFYNNINFKKYYNSIIINIL